MKKLILLPVLFFTSAFITSRFLTAQELDKKADPLANKVKLGSNASLGGRPVFPADNPWNTPIDHLPVDPNSTRYINSIGANAPLHPDFGTVYNGAPSGIPYIVVPGNQPRVPVTFDYADESDPGPYPIP